MKYLGCPVCHSDYADDMTECYQRPDLTDPTWVAEVEHGWCAMLRLHWTTGRPGIGQ